jgi:ribonuclease P protein component
LRVDDAASPIAGAPARLSDQQSRQQHPTVSTEQPPLEEPSVEQPSVKQSVAEQPVAAMRVGFTASRKVGNAVARNRAKRRLRAAADIVITQGGAPGHDVVLIARQSTASRDFAALIQDLTTGLKKLGAYRADQRP